jgi:hypothetical protein
MMHQVDEQLAETAENLWAENPYLRPTAGRYQLRRRGGEWCWISGIFRVAVSHSEAEESIAGKMFVAVNRIHDNVRVEQYANESSIFFIASSESEGCVASGVGQSPALALIDLWKSQSSR